MSIVFLRGCLAVLVGRQLPSAGRRAAGRLRKKSVLSGTI